MTKQTISIVMLGMIMMILAACNSSAARYNNQGNDDFEKAAYDDALEEYTAAKETDPELAEPYYNSGNALHNKGDLKSAVGQTQQALRLADDKLAQQAFYNLGNAYFLAEDWPAAIKAYQDSLLLDPNDKEAKHNLELALRKVQRQSQQSGDGQPQPNQPGDNQGEGDQPQNQDGDQPGGEEEGQEGPGGEEENEEEGGGGGDEEELSPEEAKQLLDNLSQNSQTLQERLNQSFDGQGSRQPLAQDW